MGAAKQSRPSVLFTNTEPASWRQHAPNRGLVFGVIGMTALMSVTAVSALFIVPQMGQQAALEAMAAETAIAPAKQPITTITAEPTGRKGRLGSAPAPVADAAALNSDMVGAADPRWVAGATSASKPQPFDVTGAIPGADRIVVTDPKAIKALALEEEASISPATPETDPRQTAGIEPEPADAKAKPDAATRSATTKQSVNLRSQPKQGGKVIGVIPAKEPVELVSCTKWCEVVFKGQRGYIYKSFVK